jgi:hypothetical protein
MISESIGIPPHLSLPGRSIPASVFAHDHHALGHIENATKSQHPTKERKAMTTQVMHSRSPEPDPREEFWRCASAKFFRANHLGLVQKIKEK